MAVTKQVVVGEHPRSGKALTEEWTDEKRHGLSVPLDILHGLISAGKRGNAWSEKPYKYPKVKLAADISLLGGVVFEKGTVILCDENEVLSVKGTKPATHGGNI